MATAVHAALDEVRAQLAEIQPEYEGLQDFRRLNLEPEAFQVVRGLESEYSARIGHLTRTAEALENLLINGYPTIPSVEVDPEVLNDLKANMETVQAAFKRFNLGTAGSLGLSANAPEPK